MDNPIRLTVQDTFHWAGLGLMISGFPLHGIVEPGMRLGNGTGLRVKVLSTIAPTPRDRREGWTTVVVEDIRPTPVTVGTVLVVEEAPTIAYRYLMSSETWAVAEATPGTSRVMWFDRISSSWRFAETPPTDPNLREVTREEMAAAVRAQGVWLPQGPGLRRWMLERRGA